MLRYFSLCVPPSPIRSRNSTTLIEAIRARPPAGMLRAASRARWPSRKNEYRRSNRELFFFYLSRILPNPTAPVVAPVANTPFNPNGAFDGTVTGRLALPSAFAVTAPRSKRGLFQ